MLFKKEDIIIVTGASSGIGRALALNLNENGASVVAVGRSLEKLEKVKEEAVCSVNFYIEQKDLTQDVEKLPDYIKFLKEKYGKFKGLACVAGVDKVATLQMLNLKDIQEVFSINYNVPMFLSKGFADRRNNVGRGANILFIASISGLQPEKGQIIYGASKAALIAASQAISKEVSPRGIRCNCISPAWVETPLYERQKNEIGVSTDNYSLGIGQPSDVANLGSFLMSDNAGWITAANYTMEGGKC